MNAGELSQKITFGKYKGLTIVDVLVSDPSYLVWACDNVEFFPNFSTEIYDLAKATMPPPRKRRSNSCDNDDPDWIDIPYDPEW